MTRMNEMIRWEISSNALSNAVVGAINQTLKNTSERLLLRVQGHRDESISIDDFVKIKNEMHEFMHEIIDIIGYAPMNVEYLIKVFYEKFGLIGVAYLRAALYSDNISAPDSLVYEAELFYPGWKDLSIEVIKVIGKLPISRERRYFYGTFVGYKLTDEDNIKNIPMLYWNGKRYNYEGRVVK